MKDGKSFTFSSLNWKSLVEAQEHDAGIPGLRPRPCATPSSVPIPQARLRRRQALGLWAPDLALAIASLLAMVYLIWQALQMGATGVALMGVLLAIVGVWQIEPMIRLNKPRAFPVRGRCPKKCCRRRVVPAPWSRCLARIGQAMSRSTGLLPMVGCTSGMTWIA